MIRRRCAAVLSWFCQWPSQVALADVVICCFSDDLRGMYERGKGSWGGFVALTSHFGKGIGSFKNNMYVMHGDRPGFCWISDMEDLILSPFSRLPQLNLEVVQVLQYIQIV